MSSRFVVATLLMVIGIYAVSCGPAGAQDQCIKITGARFEQLYFDVPLGYYHYSPDEPIELVLVISGENMNGSPSIYVDGRKLKGGWHQEWRYGVRNSDPGSYVCVDYETDYSRIWIRGMIPNGNPQDHVIEIVRSKTCRSNKFHAAW